MYKNLALEIIDLLGLNPDEQLKRPIRGLSGITTISLIESLISTDSIKKAADSLGYSDNPVKQLIRKKLSPLFPERSRDFYSHSTGECRWRLELLDLIGYKHCYMCNTTKSIKDFGSNKHERNSKHSHCKTCCTAKTKKHKYYIVERTPEWSNLDSISDIYNKCPRGFVVDHIIPLRGKLVSGLHVPNNLQYLSAEDNLKKSNSYIIN